MVPEDLSDVAQRNSATQQLGGQGVPQPMRMHIGDARPSARSGQDGSDGSGCIETNNGRAAPQKDSPVFGWGTPMMEVVRQRLTDIGEEWKAITAPTLPDHHNHTGLPVDVVESQPDHLTTTKPQTQRMRRKWNRGQRVVVVVGLGVALYFFGGWITTRGTGAQYGWVAYAPLSNTYNTPNVFGGFHSWVRLVIWLLLILVWVVVSVFLLRSPSTDPGVDNPGDANMRESRP